MLTFFQNKLQTARCIEGSSVLSQKSNKLNTSPIQSCVQGYHFLEYITESILREVTVCTWQITSIYIHQIHANTACQDWLQILTSYLLPPCHSFLIVSRYNLLTFSLNMMNMHHRHTVISSSFNIYQRHATNKLAKRNYQGEKSDPRHISVNAKRLQEVKRIFLWN